MPSDVKSLAFLAAMALMVHASPASFARHLPKILGRMSPVGGLMGHVGELSGEVMEPNKAVDEDGGWGDIRGVPFEQGELQGLNPPAWQICRGKPHLSPVASLASVDLFWGPWIDIHLGSVPEALSAPSLIPLSTHLTPVGIPR